MAHRVAKRWICAVTVALLAAAGPLALLSTPGLRPSDMLIQRWRAELATAPHDLVPVRLAQIAAMGDDALPVLVEALMSERTIVFTASRDALDKQLSLWQRLPSSQSSPKVARLARSLAEQRDRFGPQAREAAANLATRILLWPIDRNVIDGPQLVADCETVLRNASAGAVSAVAEHEAPNAARGGTHPGLDARRLVALHGVAADAVATETMSLLAGGDLTGEIAEAPILPRVTGGAASDAPTTDDSPRIYIPLPTLTLESSRETPAPAPGRPEGDHAARLADRRGGLADGKRSGGGGPRRKVTPGEVAKRSAVQLMQELRGEDEAVCRAAAGELRRRGFQPIHLLLGRQLVDPDPSVRLKLLEALPQVAGVDARPWLIWLSRDEDPSVRKAAVATIATGSDPALRERLMEMDSEESDPEVLRFVRRVLYPAGPE